VVAARETTGVSDLDATLTAIVERAARLAGADVVIARIADESGALVAHAVHARSESVRAELEGSRLDIASIPETEATGLEELPRGLREAAERIAAVDALRLPVRDNGILIGSVELMRGRSEFDELQAMLARAAADEVGLAWRAYMGEPGRATRDPLELAGDALAAGSAEAHADDQVAHLAAEATDARACLVWRFEEDDEPELASLAGPDSAAAPAYARDVLLRARVSREPVTVEQVGEPGWLVTLQLGEPPVGALQLLFAQELDRQGSLLPRLATFAVRAAHALRTSERRHTLAADLDRTQALLGIVGQAIAELSLTHTLDTAVDRVRDLLAVDGLAVYLAEEGGDRLETAGERGLTGPHVRIGERLLEVALGPARGRGLVIVEDAAADPRLVGARDAVEEVGIQAAIGVPLRAGDQLIGLLAVYPGRGRTLTENEESLLRALVAQLAVAVQNAQLHEKVERESGEAKRARDEEAQVSRRLRALYDISRSFTESLSLEEAFDVVVQTIVHELGVDAAVLRIPHERGDALIPAATHVREERLAQDPTSAVARQQVVAEGTLLARSFNDLSSRFDSARREACFGYGRHSPGHRPTPGQHGDLVRRGRHSV